MIKAPYFAGTRVFATDNGFSYRIQIWMGDVDYLNTPPTLSDESTKAYKTSQTATRAMLARLTAIVIAGPTVNTFAAGTRKR